MNESETEFLALVALGAFSIDALGQIWRHKEWTKGSHNGSDPALVSLGTPRRADVSSSGIRHENSTNYRRVMFVAKGERMSVHAHRVVWMLANGEPIPRGLEINHKDGDGTNNRPANLEVVTASENMTHAIRVLGVRRKKAQPGQNNSQAKITDETALKIRALAEQKSMPQWKIGELFGVSQQTVANIHARRTWKHLA